MPHFGGDSTGRLEKLAYTSTLYLNTITLSKHVGWRIESRATHCRLNWVISFCIFASIGLCIIKMHKIMHIPASRRGSGPKPMHYEKYAL
ncbi:hypothetical protein FB451DRAFT_1233400 [Mycena latifolia]|nr:hypothetical protein FB451DRAFT_1233400 [Mycena latifolia]